ncbi:MAG: hypothetical protein ACM33B_15545 [Pseudomonadota bacterium]
MARRSTADMQKAKEARQKKIAIVGGVIFLAVAGIQGPRTMKMLKGAEDTSAAPPPPATTVPTQGGLALPPVSTTETTPVGGTSGGTDAGPVAVAGQLVSFTRFASKDPFVQQIDQNDAGTASGGGAAPSGGDPGSGSGSGSGSGGSAPGAATGSGSGSGGSGGGASKPPAPTTATIAVNGSAEPVAVGRDFPAKAPLFHLVKLTAGTALVGIAGGSYASGEQTATLRKGRTLVLQNTADGTRYELKLVSVG